MSLISYRSFDSGVNIDDADFEMGFFSLSNCHIITLLDILTIPAVDLHAHSFFLHGISKNSFHLIDKNAAWRHTYHSRQSDGLNHLHMAHISSSILCVCSIKSSQIAFIWIYSIHNLLWLFALISTKSHLAI